ncbi:MAG: hypothetical protein ABNH00_09050 [Dokdonia sp.]|jgi:hypothetical protein
MESIIVLSKSIAILTIFYLTYILVLRKDTFFTANRHFLLGGILAALLLPFVSFTTTAIVDIPVTAVASLPEVIANTPSTTAITTQPLPQINWWLVVFSIYLVGVCIMLGRLMLQLHSLHKLFQRFPHTKNGLYTYIAVNEDIAPFSFFRKIVFNPKLHTLEELKMIIDHEKVHAIQWHTVDVLLTQCILALQWPNPFAWLYKNSLEQNLEFIADHQAARNAASAKAYQHTLVKVSSTALRPALTNNFYHSLIKKRIVMLNKPASHKRNIWKLGFVLPCLAVFMYSFHVKEVIAYREVTLPTATTSNEFSDTSLPSDSLSRPSLSHFERSIFTISEETSKEDLIKLEHYFQQNFESTAIRIVNPVFDNNTLTSFEFQSKMAADDRFKTRFAQHPNNTVIKAFEIVAVKEHEVHIVYKDKSGIVILKPDNLVLEEAVQTAAPTDKIKVQSFTVNSKTTNLELERIEDYFEDNFPEALLRFRQVNRLADGTLASYRIDTKFKNQSTWNQILGVPDFRAVSKGVQITPVQAELGPIITIQELGPKGVTMTAKPDGIHLTSEALIKATVPRAAFKTTNTTMKTQQSFRYKISKFTSLEELSAIKKELKDKHQVDFEYSDIDFNADNEIAAIRLTYKTSNGNTGNYNVSQTQGIADIYFYMEANGGVGLGNDKNAAITQERIQEKRALIEERRDALRARGEARRAEMEKRREQRIQEAESSRQERQKQLTSRQNELRERIKENATSLKARQIELKEKQQAQGYRQNNFTHQQPTNITAKGVFIVSNDAGITTSDIKKGLYVKRISTTTSDNELALIKKTFKENGATMNYSSVKRNAEGQITAIRIKLKRDSDKASVTFDGSNPIQTLHLGFILK